MENYSLSDIAAATGSEGFGGNMGYFWIFALLLLANGGLGFGGNNAATSASQQEILFNQQFDRIAQQNQSIANGLSSLGYSQLQQMDANTSSINGNITSEGRSLQNQIAECCCSTKEAIHAEGEATRNLIQADKIATLQNRINTLEMQNTIASATAGVVRYPTSTTYTSGNNPFCGCNCAY